MYLAYGIKYCMLSFGQYIHLLRKDTKNSTWDSKSQVTMQPRRAAVEASGWGRSNGQRDQPDEAPQRSSQS